MYNHRALNMLMLQSRIMSRIYLIYHRDRRARIPAVPLYDYGEPAWSDRGVTDFAPIAISVKDQRSIHVQKPQEYLDL